MELVRSYLSTIDPFSHLPSNEMDELLSKVVEKSHSKGEQIFLEGEQAESVWVLLKGKVEIYKYTSDGKPRAIEVIGPRDLFGTLCRLGSGGKTYPCTAIAVLDSLSAQLPNLYFLEILQKYPSVLKGVCGLCSTRLNMMQELTCISSEPVEKRIVRVLFQLSNTHGSVLPFTKRQISELAATTVETTIRTLSKFQKKNWISSSRGNINIKNTEKLEGVLR